MKGRMLLAIALVGLASGCGGKKLVPVTGVVYLDDKPLPGATVSFQPVAGGKGTEAGFGSYGKTDDQGRYTLKTVDGNHTGATVGEHRVQISIPIPARSNRGDVAANATMSDKLHANYNRESKLKFTVPEGGTESADFRLTRGGDVP